MSKKRAAQRSYAEWERLIDDWSRSGQSQSRFAKAHGINPRTFQGQVWRSGKRKELSLKGKGVPYRFVEVSPPSPAETQQGGGCRITMSNTEMAFSSSSDATWIAEILSRLGHGR